MSWFLDEKTENAKKMLKQSQQDFSFGKEPAKFRLLQSINDVPPRPVRAHWHAFRYSVAMATLLIFISGTFAFASNAKPGEKLFKLNKVGERMVLSLPLPSEQQAQIQAAIVNRRLQALDDLKSESSKNQSYQDRKLATVKESDETLSEAVETITTRRDALEAKGDVQEAQKLDVILNRLDTLAESHEKNFQELEDDEEDENIKIIIHTHLERFQESRKKTHKESPIESEESD